jgi:hypothetical protein
MCIARSEVREEIQTESRSAIAHEIDEKHCKDRQTRHHHDEAQDHEDLVQHLAS